MSVRPKRTSHSRTLSLAATQTPLNYPVEFVHREQRSRLLTPIPGLGLPAGSFFYHRLGAYVGESSKWKKNFTLSYGVRYVRETGRSDSEFPAIPQLNALIPGLGNRVRQPNSNFAPQLGFAWDPSGNGKTSIRGGIGLFYENVLTIVAAFDPLVRAAKGQCLRSRSRPRAMEQRYLSPCLSQEARSNRHSAARRVEVRSPSELWPTRSLHSRNNTRPTLLLI